MSKQIAIISVTIVFVVTIGLLIAQILKYRHSVEDIKQLPEIELKTINGEIFILSNTENTPLVINYFHPTCILCKQEIEDIIQYSNRIPDALFLFITSEESDDLYEFLRDYPIDKYVKSKILIDCNYQFSTIFKPQAPPMMYIYTPQHTLSRIFKGRTSMETIKIAIRNASK